MSGSSHDTPNRDPRRARVAPAQPGGGWVKPKHGNGMLRPFQPGNDYGRNARPSYYAETVALAREASPEALRVLIERLRDPDGRIAVVAANSILERAFGKVREARPEDQPKAAIDLSSLSNAELAILMKLVESGRLRPTSSEPQGSGAVVDARHGEGATSTATGVSSR